jgi:HSP20 family protein
MVMRFDPFREPLEQVLRSAAEGRAPRAIVMDAYRHGDHFVIHFDVPGVAPDSIELTAEQNLLTVRAERNWPEEAATEVVVNERLQGTFGRQVFLGEGLDPERIEATCDLGVLTVKIPVAERAKARRVQVSQRGEGAQTVRTDHEPTG